MQKCPIWRVTISTISTGNGRQDRPGRPRDGRSCPISISERNLIPGNREPLHPMGPVVVEKAKNDPAGAIRPVEARKKRPARQALCGVTPGYA